MRPDSINIFTPSSTLKDLQALERALDDAPSGGGPEISIRLTANFSSQFLARSLSSSLKVFGLEPTVIDDSYDQWEQRLMALDDEVHTDWLIVALSTRPFAVQRRWEDPEALANRINELISAYLHVRSEKILLMLPEYLPEALFADNWLNRWTTSLRFGLRDALFAVPEVELFDPNLLISAVGADRWHSATDWETSKFPLDPRLFPYLGAALASNFYSWTKPWVKIIAVDFDNTLWGGEVGDFGPGGVDLDPHAKGYGHLLLQRFLRDQKERGVTLIGLTKNEESVAREVFNQRREMILRWEDFAIVQANFRPKSENLASALELLGLSDEGLVFLDDSRFEIEEVRRRFPSVWTHDFPANFSELTHELARTHLFGAGQVSEVSRQRTTLYQQEMERKKLGSLATNLDSFLSGLQMKLSVEPLGYDNSVRVAELLARTNQFNLTRVSLTAEALRKLAQKADSAVHPEVLLFTLEDNFGSYGQIAACILDHESGSGQITLTNMVVSCRVFGRGVEHAILKHLQSRLVRGYESLEIPFHLTDRNHIAKEVLTKCLESTVNDGTRLVFKMTRDTKIPGTFVDIVS